MQIEYIPIWSSVRNEATVELYFVVIISTIVEQIERAIHTQSCGWNEQVCQRAKS